MAFFLCFKENTRLLQEINYFVYLYIYLYIYIVKVWYIYIYIYIERERVYLLFGGEYQIYFIECGEKISIFHECIFILKGKYRKHNLTFSLVVSCSTDFFIVFIGYKLGLIENYILTNET